MEKPPEFVPAARVAGYCLAIMMIAAAAIHFAIAAKYVEQYWLFGISTLVIGWLQGLWAIAVIARQSRTALRVGAVFNAAVLVLSLVTLTTGDAIGAAPKDAGLSSFGNVLCAVLEAVAVAGCGWLLTTGGSQQVRQRLMFLPAATAAVTAVLLGTALAVAGQDSVASPLGSTGSGTVSSSGSSTGSGMNMPGMSAAAMAIRLPTTSPAGDITMPNPDMQMADGMRMASSVTCAATPTAQQQRAAVTMVDTSWQDAQKYRNLAAARAAGYQPITPVGAPVVHYLSQAAYRATVLGGPVLDFADPQSLVYANTPKGAVLVAAMYITSPGGPTPQPGGCLTQWHVHTNLCLTRGLGVTGSVGGGNTICPAGSVNRVTPPMIHVWYVPIPGGPTAVDAQDPQVVQAAELVSAPVNGTA
jgi:hypothetical protein